jgi:integrase
MRQQSNSPGHGCNLVIPLNTPPARRTTRGQRSLLTDLLNERGFNADAIERQLDHVSRDKVRAAYLRSDFYHYRRRMMQWVAD